MKRILIGTPAVLGVAILLTTGFPSVASAGLTTWELRNHPDGNAQPPLYGLRLDGLYSGDSSDIWSFDFDDDDSNMRLTYDDTAQEIRIFGQVFGGRDLGGAYDPALSGMWNVDFTYEMNVSEDGGSGFGLTVDPASSDNAGTIMPTFSALVNTGSESGVQIQNKAIDLTDKSNGNFAFKFNNTDDHRLAGHGMSGPETFVGWGWLNHSIVPSGELGYNAGLERHIKASDWLFTGTKVEVPIPGTLALLGLGLLGLGAASRRRG